MRYIPLNIKTHYNLLSSLIKVDDLINYALKNNIDTLGINDENMFSFSEFYYSCIKNNIKPIVSVPLVINDVKFDLYIRNFEGYKNASKIITKKNLDVLDKKYLKEHNEGLICVLDFDSYKYYQSFCELYDLVYLSYSSEIEKEEASKITNNILYRKEIRMFNKTDSRNLKLLYMLKDGATIKSEYYFDEKLNDTYFEDDVSLIDSDTTKSFSDLIDLVIPKIEFVIPKINDEDSSSFLKNMCIKGLTKRLNGNITKEYSDRLEYELSIIEKMGFVDYFLVVYDFILYAKKNNILVGPGRGSGVSSLVSYSLGIIDIDPLKYNLIFERFLNPERISMPDIDTDFEDVRRDDVINYVKDKYGKENVANIIAFDTLMPKACIRDVGRVLDVEPFLIDNLCKTIKNEKTFKELENNRMFVSVRAQDSIYDNLLSICKVFEGLKRHTTIHAAGVVISGKNISESCPLYKSEDNILTCYTKEYLESFGLIKMDFLALSNLTIIKDVISLIEKEKGIKINLNKIPFDDKKTLNLFKCADTIGIFQFESSGMRNVLRKMQADSFNDLVAIISLYRPGPREEIPSYINRKHGKEKITYLFKELESILKDTYGIIVYQEQVLEILRVIGNYSYAEADIVRKAMSKKSDEVILKERDKFINNAVKNGYELDKLNILFDKIQKFSEYGFNKSHAVAYSVIAYWMQYLKSNFKEYFMANLLNSVIGSEEKTKEYMDEAKVLGIDFILPDVNSSNDSYNIEENKLTLPLNVIKNVGRESSIKIIEERKNSKYLDYFDFIRRNINNGINKKIITSLIEADALRSFGYNKKTLIENLENAINYASLCNEIDESLVEKPIINIVDEYDSSKLMELEYNSYGFYYSNHPVTRYRRSNEVTLKNIEAYFDKRVSVIVYIENIKTIDTKDKERMAFLTGSDEYRKIDMVLFPREYEKNYDIKKGAVIRVNAKVEKRMSEYQLVINKIEYLMEGKND